MTRKATKKALEQKIRKVVTDLCHESKDGPYPYVVGTTLGLLWVSPHEDWIACRFEEPEKAREVYLCNPFSGKYNFHSDHCDEDFIDLIESLENRGRLVDSDQREAQLQVFRVERERRIEATF